MDKKTNFNIRLIFKFETMMSNSSRHAHLVNLGDEVNPRECCLGVVSLEIKLESRCEHQELNVEGETMDRESYPHIPGIKGTVQN